MGTEVQVERANLRNTRSVAIAPAPLAEGQVRVAIDRFALTANNVSYAVTGEQIGYWRFFPAAGEWGKVPVWGFADVEASATAQIGVGERLYGFFPMASHATLSVGNCGERHFIEASPHRAELPAAYNLYRRASRDPGFDPAAEDARCLLYPLLLTAYLLYDYLDSHDYFGAQQVLIGSVSSKTGLGLAHFLHRLGGGRVHIVGLTSPANVDYIAGLGLCDQVVAYGDETGIDASLPTAWFDMSGNARLTERLHRLLGDSMRSSCLVGFTHWEQLGRLAAGLPGAPPAFFFAPDHIASRDAELGKGVLIERANSACAGAASAIAAGMDFTLISGAAQAMACWRELLDNRISPRRGIIARI